MQSNQRCESRRRKIALRKRCDEVIKKINLLGPDDEMLDLEKEFPGYTLVEYTKEMQLQAAKIKRFIPKTNGRPKLAGLDGKDTR